MGSIGHCIPVLNCNMTRSTANLECSFISEKFLQRRILLQIIFLLRAIEKRLKRQFQALLAIRHFMEGFDKKDSVKRN